MKKLIRLFAVICLISWISIWFVPQYAFSEISSREAAETPARSGPAKQAVGRAVSGLFSKMSVNKTSAETPFITIVESRSINSGHTQDLVWMNVVTSLGYSGAVVPQTTLDSTNFFATTDLLIISSGVIDIPNNRRETILHFLKQGRPVYLQGEYLSSFQSNQTFQELVDSLGGSFSWTGTVNGALNPMNILGIMGTIPNAIPSLNYFWYGCAGSGDSTIENYLEYSGQYFGFIFTPPNPAYGKIVTSSDQDWAIVGAEKEQFMENIICYLLGIATNIPNDNSQFSVVKRYELKQNYPNPFNPATRITYTLLHPGEVSLKIFDMLGKEVATLVQEFQAAGTYTIDFNAGNLAGGIYFYRLQTGEFVATRKMLLMR